MIVNIMNKKTGIYIISGGVVCFTSTIPWNDKSPISELQKQIEQVHNYWKEHGRGTSISSVILSGHGSLADGIASKCCLPCSSNIDIHVEVGNVWQNVFSYDKYIPPISHEDSLDYATSAGLALPLYFI